MPITLPAIDDRNYDQIVNDVLARAQVHTPEWTHTGPSDPGVTLVELFGFMAETLLYRANLIPDRNRLKFLQLLGIPLLPASPAQGLVQLSNDNGELRNFTLPPGLSYYAGTLPFVSEAGLDVPPVEGYACFKSKVETTDPALLDYYRELYEATGRDWATAGGLSANTAIEPVLYETIALSDLPGAFDAGTLAVDGALWIALLKRNNLTAPQTARVREQLSGRTLSIGLVPAKLDASTRIVPGMPAAAPPNLSVWMPRAEAAAGTYRRLDSLTPEGFPERIGILQVTLPSEPLDPNAPPVIDTWPEGEPLENGVGELPPLITDDALAARVLSWLRIDGLAGSGGLLAWAGIHCVPLTQRRPVNRELLAPGDGSAEQMRQMEHGQVISDSVALTVGGEDWLLTDELESAPPEGKTGSKVFALDAEAGLIRFGDGVHGARPAESAEIAVRYDWTDGAAGNVATGTIKLAPNLPPGFKASNPIPCKGGVSAEDARSGEKRIPQVLRHRNRAVTEEDFREILNAAPGADVGRIEVLSAWHPELSPALPGDQPGVVTVLAIPRVDPIQPDRPMPDAEFINALCRHLAPRRLVTCEVLLRPPVYNGVWISVGIEIAAGQSVAVVRENVRTALRGHLSPLSPGITGAPTPKLPGLDNGWPLFRAVSALELAAVVARTEGVGGVAGLLLADSGGSRRDSVSMLGLQLPYIAGLSITLGDPVPLDELIGRSSDSSGGTGGGDGGGTPALRLPVPKIPSTC